MPKSLTSVQINVTVNKRDKAISDEIARRAAALGPRWSLSAYGLEIWRWWLEQGAPPVSRQDQAMIVAGQMNLPATKSSSKYPVPHDQRFSVNQTQK